MIGADPDGMNINDGVGYRTSSTFALRCSSTEPTSSRTTRRRPLPRRRRRRRDRRRRPHHGDPRRVDAGARHAHRRHPRRHRHVEPRAPSRWPSAASASSRPRSATATCSRRSRGRLRARRRAVGPRHHDRVRHDGRRAHGPTSRPRWPARASRSPTSRGHDGVPAGARQRAGRGPPRPRGGRGDRGRRGAAEAELRDTAACCFVRRAPSRWCGSCKRPPISTQRSPTSSASRPSCGSASVADGPWRAAASARSELAQQHARHRVVGVLAQQSDARDRVGRMFCSGSAR